MITDEELREAMIEAFLGCPESWGPSWVAAARKARELLCPKPKEHWRKVRVGQVWQWMGVDVSPPVVEIEMSESKLRPLSKAHMAPDQCILLRPNGTPSYTEWHLIYDPNEEDA